MDKVIYAFLRLHDLVLFWRKPVFRETGLIFQQTRAIVRWGDGETQLLLGQSISCQTHSPELARELRPLMSQERDGLVLCVPKFLIDLKNSRNFTPRERLIWLKTAVMMRLLLPPRRVVGDAFMFRKEGYFGGWPGLLNKAVDAKAILIVGSNTSGEACLRVEGFIGDIHFIETPPKNAYNARAKIRDEVVEMCSRHPIGLVLFSAGPVSKVLIPDLLSILPTDVFLYDTGHLFDHRKEV